MSQPRGPAHYKWKPKVETTCHWCGKVFLVFPYRAGSAKYCSPSCRSKAPKTKSRKVSLVCGTCGKTYRVCPVFAKTSHYCCRACADAGHGESVAGPKSHLWKGGKIERPCARCGKIIMVNPGDKRRRCCSRKCASGPGSHLWRGGVFKAEYPACFSRTFRRSIRTRDGYTCAMCGKRPAYDVHHIDYNKANTAEGNCVTLCHPCHSRTNVNREHWQGLLMSLLSP